MQIHKAGEGVEVILQLGGLEEAASEPRWWASKVKGTGYTLPGAIFRLKMVVPNQK